MKVETRKQDEVKLGGWEGGKCQPLSPLFRLPLIATLLPLAAKQGLHTHKRQQGWSMVIVIQVLPLQKNCHCTATSSSTVPSACATRL